MTFGDIVGLDTTHSSNDARLHLHLSVLGEGEDNTHTTSFHIFSDESEDSIGAALGFQRSVVQFSHHTILIDKDFTEISTLRSALPDDDVLLCRLHVIKYFRQCMAVTYLQLDVDETATGFWIRMMYADIEEE